MRRQIYKNNLMIAVAFMLQGTAFNGIGNLQSSINCVAGLGTYTIAAVYGALGLSSLFLPKVVIQMVGLKWTLVASSTVFIVYTICNFYPSFETLIPAAALVGLGAAPLWTSQAQYLTVSAGLISTLDQPNRKHSNSEEHWVNRFFGMFFLIYQLNQVCGNLISSLVIQGGFPNANSLPYQNETMAEATRHRCGLNFTAADEDSCDTLDTLDSNTSYILMGIYTSCSVLAFLILVMVDQLEVPDLAKRESVWQLIQATIRHIMHDRYQWCLIPISLYFGLQRSLMMECFTASYVSCTFGSGWIGYTMLVYGVADAIFSFLVGITERWVGRIRIFAFGGTLNTVLMIALLAEWIYPNPNHIESYFVFAVGWGICDAVWQCNVKSLYGVIFKDRQAVGFANFYLWQSLGYCAGFGYGSVLNAKAKLYICITVLIAGMAGYAVVEVLERRVKLKNTHESEDKENTDSLLKKTIE